MIVLLGNCQLQRISYIFRINGIDCQYFANTKRVDDEFNVERSLEAISKASLVIAQPIFNKSSPLYHQCISKVASEAIFLPYLYIEGLFSLESTDIGSSVILGSEALLPFLQRSYEEMIGHFQTGRIDFRCRERLDASLVELQTREKEIESLVVSDIIADNWQKRPLIISHNHPNKWLLDRIAERLFQKIKRPYRRYEELTHYQRAEYLFSEGEAVLSPYDIDELGLRYKSNDQWWNIGNRLLRRYWDHHCPS